LRQHISDFKANIRYEIRGVEPHTLAEIVDLDSGVTEIDRAAFAVVHEVQ
jgi:hypothetical protein